MNKRPGMIMTLPDGRKVIRYNKQPLLKQGKVVLHLLNDDLSLKKNDDKELTLLKSVADYNAMLDQCKLVGYVD